MPEMPEQHAVKLPACPYCNYSPTIKRNAYSEDDVVCTNSRCRMCGFAIPINTWTNRPIEDALRDERDVAEARVSQLERAISESPSEVRQLKYVINEVASTLIDYIDQDSKEGAIMRQAYLDLMEAYDGNYTTVSPNIE